MIRVLAIVCVVLAACLPVALRAQTANWLKVAAAEIDLRKSGMTTIDLPDADYGELRFQADKPVTLSSVKTLVAGALPASSGSYTANKGTPSKSFLTSAAGAKVKSVDIAWSADPQSAGTVKLEVWALPPPGNSVTVAEGVAKKSEAPANLPAQPQSRSIGAPMPSAAPAPAPPPPPAGTRGIASDSASEPRARSIAGAAPSGQAAPGAACVKDTVCTIVDVFFGTDRNQVDGAERTGFGQERSHKLSLGHAVVTVPKAKRKPGEIPLPSIMDRWLWGVPPEGNPAQHFTIPRNGVDVYGSEDEFVAFAKKHIASVPGASKDHAFIFIHGFYVTFDNALYRTAQISYDLSNDGKPFGTAFLYSWPSAGDPTAYVYDQDSANFASKHLKSFIQTVVDKTGVKNVHIIAHSMGNVALIGALKELASTEKTAKINQIILAAPDYDKAEFESIITSVEKVAKGLTLYASQVDRALALARTARRGLPRAGEAFPPGGPAVVTGIDTIDVTAISTDAFWGGDLWRHDTYADSKEILSEHRGHFHKGRTTKHALQEVYARPDRPAELLEVFDVWAR